VISHSAAAINYLKDLVDGNQFKPVVDRTYALDQIADAHAYAEKGHKKGNIAITV